MDYSIDNQDENALARLFFTALSGDTPSPEARSKGLDYWRSMVVTPWEEQDSNTQAYGEGFFSSVSKLKGASKLHAKWKSEFNTQHFPSNNDCARAFLREFFHELLHIQRPYHDFFCLGLTMGSTPALDWRIAHPTNIEDWSIYTTAAGEGQITGIGGPAIALPLGTLALVPPGCSCTVQRSNSALHWQVNWLSFRSREEWFELMDWSISLDRPIVLPIKADATEAHIDRLMRELQTTPYQRGDINERLCHNLIETLLIRMRRLYELEYGAAFSDPRVRKTIHYLLPRFRESISLEQIAAKVNLSPGRLNALFREHYGTSVIKWRDNLRLQKAKELLSHGDMAITRVAAYVGYDDPLYFSRRFKAQFGMPPRAYKAHTK